MSAERDGNWELYQVEIDSGSIKRITNNPANDGLPAISPDGGQVAFLSNRNGRWGIWTIGLSGGAPRLVWSIDSAIPNWLAQGIDWAE
jgi:Tol biopolymer transport system component